MMDREEVCVSEGMDKRHDFCIRKYIFYVSKMRDTQLDESVRIVHVFMHGTLLYLQNVSFVGYGVALAT